MIFVWIGVGIAIGIIAAGVFFMAKSKATCVGTLREDRSVPDEPYLFLELEQDGMAKIHRLRRVTLSVSLDNYLPR